MFKHDTVVIFDFETSGLSPFNSQVIEIGAIKLKKNQETYEVIETLDVLVKCDLPLTQQIINITHITDDMLLKQGISEEEAFYRLYNLIENDTLLIAYNIQFDLSFLDTLYKKYIGLSYIIKNDVLDAMAVYKDRYKYPHRLESAIQTFQIHMENAHRAIHDAMGTYQVLKKLSEEKDNLSHYVNKVGYNKKYGVSGPRLKHVIYIPQYGGFREIERT